MLILVTAVPYTWRGRSTPQVSDGKRLLSLLGEGRLWAGCKAQEAMRQRVGLTEVGPAPSLAWPEVAYQVTRPDRLRESWSRRDACTVLHGLLADPALTWFERLLAHEELIIQEASHGDGIVPAAALDAWSAAALDRAPTLPLQVAWAGAPYRLGRWDEAEAMLGPWIRGAAGRTGALAQQFAARLLIARARAELTAVHSGSDQVRQRAPNMFDGGS